MHALWCTHRIRNLSIGSWLATFDTCGLTISALPCVPQYTPGGYLVLLHQAPLPTSCFLRRRSACRNMLQRPHATNCRAPTGLKKRCRNCISNQNAAAESSKMFRTLYFATFAPNMFLCFLTNGFALPAQQRVHLPTASIWLG